MRKLKILFIISLIFIGIKSVDAFDNTLKVYDYAQVLTEKEESKLKSSIDSYINEYNMDMVLVTVKYHTKNTTKEYAEDFYDYNNFGIGNTKDGILFVIDFTFGYTDIYILTTGEAIRIYDDNRIDKMLDNIANKKDKGYYHMFESFTSDASNYANLGVPSSNSNTKIDSNGDLVYLETIHWPLIIIFSLLTPTIIVLIFVFKNRMVKKSTTAAYYLKDGSVVINVKRDNFITTNTTSVRINDSSSSSGGSSVSRGSSGRSHGGGGRRL